MLSQRTGVLLLTAVAPMLWGTTYVTTTSLLLSDHPLLTATLRALPAGLLLLLVARQLPRGSWWWRSAVLGILNFAAFFALLFVAADRLPGGVAAVVGGIQPLVVSVLATGLLRERVSTRTVVTGIAGLAGVALIVLQADARLDAVGVAAALTGALAMALGVVLAKRWGQPAPPLVTTSWQLVHGGLILAVLTVLLEPLPASPPTTGAVLGYAYLALVGTALAYVLWFRGIAALPAQVPAFLGLLSPVVAVAIGVVAVGETLTWPQVVGVVTVLATVAVVVRRPVAPGSRPTAPEVRPAAAGSSGVSPVPSDAGR